MSESSWLLALKEKGAGAVGNSFVAYKERNGQERKTHDGEDRGSG